MKRWSKWVQNQNLWKKIKSYRFNPIHGHVWIQPIHRQGGGHIDPPYQIISFWSREKYFTSKCIYIKFPESFLFITFWLEVFLNELRAILYPCIGPNNENL